MIKMFVMHTCPDCEYVEKQVEGNPNFEVIDIGKHVRNLKKFLDLRDTHPAFDEAKAIGDVGIPCYVLEDGTVLGAGIINQTQVDAYYGMPWEHDTDAVCVLHTLVISPQASGKGYGRAFVEFYERWAMEHGLPELRIDTNAKNTIARAMYRKLGYKEIGIVPTTFNGIPGVDLVLLEKNLKSV